MLTLALKTMRANKIRFIMTTSTVMVGVAFVVAAFVTADSLRSTFGDLSVDIVRGIDYNVRGKLPFGDFTRTEQPPVSEALLDTIRNVEGVEKADGTFFVDNVTPRDGSGQAVETLGAPVAGTMWTEDESLSQLYLTQGKRPVGNTQFAIDIGTAEQYDFVIGEEYQLTTPTGPRTFTLTGIMQFGWPENAGLGATFSVFDKSTAQEVLDAPNQFTEIVVRAKEGQNIDDLKARLEGALPEDVVEVVTASEVTEEFKSAFETVISIFQTVLLVFAFVILFVSAFIVSNTFNIILYQRIRELALLRSIGATPRQVRISVLLEALVIGASAVITGIALGMLGAVGIRGLFSALGASLPAGDLPLTLRTVIVAVTLGMIVTLIASFVPAVKASRTSPIAGLREDSAVSASKRHRSTRMYVGLGIATLGAALSLAGLFTDIGTGSLQLSLLGAGAAAVFIAVAIISPLVAEPIVSTIATPLITITGQMARKNAARNPQRTSATAVALTVGLALMAAVSVVGDSFSVTFNERLTSAVKADFIISAERPNPSIAKQLKADLADTGLGTVVTFTSTLVQTFPDGVPEGLYAPPGGLPGAPSDKLDDNTDTSTITPTEVESSISIVDISNINQVANLRISEGSLENFNPEKGLLIHRDTADARELAVGDEVPIRFITGNIQTMEVAAIYESDAFWADLMIDTQLGDQFTRYDEVITIKLASTQSDTAATQTAQSDTAATQTAIEDVIEDARVRLTEVTEKYGNVVLQTRAEFLADIEASRTTATTFVTVFLGFAVVLALFGIVNTLTLSVTERTREIGLLRSVGMTKRQLRVMICQEAITVALYGTLIGLVLGVIFGVAVAQAIPSNIVDQLSIPLVQLSIFAVMAAVFGLLAGLFPSFRASRMNVLQAISGE